MTSRTAAAFRILLLMVLSIGLLSFPKCEAAEDSGPPHLKFASAVYVGWMPWFLAAEDGTLKRHAEKHGLEIQFVRGGYLETIRQFIDGEVDAVMLTNVDALAFLVRSRVESDIILIGSYSHGNDAILLRPGVAKDLAGGPVGLVEFSVSHYLLDRYLERENIPFDRVERRNVEDFEVTSMFMTPGSELIGVVTWNPMVRKIERWLNVKRVFDSRMLESEIADILVVRRSVLREHPVFAQALLGTWFELMNRMRGPKRFETVEALAALSGMRGRDYEHQLNTTLFIRTPEVGLGYLRDPYMKQVTQHVRTFVERHAFVSSSVSGRWVSYAGETPAILFFNDQPLMDYVAEK